MAIQARSTSHQVWSKKASSGAGAIAKAALQSATVLPSSDRAPSHQAPSHQAPNHQAPNHQAPNHRVSSHAEANAIAAPPQAQSSQISFQSTVPNPVLAVPLQRPGSYYGDVVGAVVFDWNGLPQEYFVIPESELLPWEQTVFQMLGLRWLLMSYLNLGGFYHAKVSCEHYSAFVVRQREYYMAILLERSEIRDSDPAFMEWLQTFEVSYLRSDPRFQHH